MTVAIKSIKIDQAEGWTNRLIRGRFDTVEAANAALRNIMHQCEPDMLGYLKTDVVVEWEDGTSHKWRADVNQHGDDTNVTESLLGWARRYVEKSDGPHLKRMLSPEMLKAWEARAARLLSGDLASS